MGGCGIVRPRTGFSPVLCRSARVAAHEGNGDKRGHMAILCRKRAGEYLLCCCARSGGVNRDKGAWATVTGNPVN